MLGKTSKTFLSNYIVEIFLIGTICCVILSPMFTGPAKAEVTRYRLAYELRNQCVKAEASKWINTNKKAITYGDLAVFKVRCETENSVWWYPFSNDSVFDAQRKLVNQTE